jgi:hypothetical protein
MVKIKQKKQLNLPQLIEWGFENDVTNTWYRASNVEEYISEVFFGAKGLPQFSSTVDREDIFTVEVEEDITEDTVIPKLVVNHSDGGLSLYENDYINNEFPLDSVRAFYILNDDLTMTLIWRDGKLIKE